jgi:hypothetical protein
MKRSDCFTFTSAQRGIRFTTVPLMHVSKCGLISFNSVAVKLLNLQEKGGVLIHQSKTNPKEWAVESASTVSGGFVLRQTSAKNGALVINAAIVVKSMMSSLKQDKGFNLLVGSEPSDGLYELITSALK